VTTSERVDLTLKLLATAVAIFGVWKFFADRSAAELADARARSLSYIERFAADEMVEARADLADFWRSYPELAAWVREGQLTEREYVNFVATAYPAYGDRAAVDAALFRILVFFDEVAYCRDAGLCDVAILDSYFCGHAVRQARVYGPFYERMSAEIGARRMDAGLQDLAAHCARVHGLSTG
jgi:hypothetical protein